MAQKFPYERASSILAEAEIFGDKRTASRWRVSERTIGNYRARASEDAKLSESFLLKKRMLLLDWQQDATKSLRIGLATLQELTALRDEPDENNRVRTKGLADEIHATAGALKIVGELKIQYEALNG